MRRLDASIGGLGGCPFAPAATGNIGTEDLLYMLDRSKVATGYDLPFDAVYSCAAWLGWLVPLAVVTFLPTPWAPRLR